MKPEDLQIAGDLASVQDLDLDQVRFSNTAPAHDIEDAVRRLAELRDAVTA